MAMEPTKIYLNLQLSHLRRSGCILWRGQGNLGKVPGISFLKLSGNPALHSHTYQMLLHYVSGSDGGGTQVSSDLCEIRI